MNKNRLAALGLTVGLVGGGAAGLAFGVPGVSSAQTSSTSTPTSTNPSSTPAAPAAPANRTPGAWEKAALDPLVKNNTINQAQEDAILAALQAAKPAKPAGGRGGPGGFGGGDHGGRGGMGFGLGLDAAAKALGITTAELRTDLQGGKTVATVAKDKGVDLQKVIDAMVVEAKAHVDAEVKAGQHTQAEGDAELAQMTTAINDFVNGKMPAPGTGMPGRGGHGPNGTAPSTTSTTTA